MPATKTRDLNAPPATTRSRFTWGRIVALHRVGQYYVIVQYEPRRADNEAPENFDPSDKFHPYVRVIDDRDHQERWDDTHHSYGSFDAALVACVVYRNLWEHISPGCAMNERITEFFLRGILHESA